MLFQWRQFIRGRSLIKYCVINSPELFPSVFLIAVYYLKFTQKFKPYPDSFMQPRLSETSSASWTT